MTVLGSLAAPGRAPEADLVTASAWRSLLSHRGARVGLVLAVLLGVMAVLGPLLTGDPNTPDFTNKLDPPSSAHPLGTDLAGRDLLARTIAGARTSLGAALIVMALAVVAGLGVGVLAGATGGAVDTVLTRITDILLGLPSTIMTLAVVGLLGPSFTNLILAMAVTSWAELARLARSYSRGSATRPDVVAARMAGAGPLRIAIGHVAPGATSLVLIAATLKLGETVLVLASLSFLGLGAQPPTAEWGNMLSGSRETLAIAPWQLIGPGVGLMLTVLAATLISDALRDVTDPANRT